MVFTYGLGEVNFKWLDQVNNFVLKPRLEVILLFRLKVFFFDLDCLTKAWESFYKVLKFDNVREMQRMYALKDINLGYFSSASCDAFYGEKLLSF